MRTGETFFPGGSCPAVYLRICRGVCGRRSVFAVVCFAVALLLPCSLVQPTRDARSSANFRMAVTTASTATTAVLAIASI